MSQLKLLNLELKANSMQVHVCLKSPPYNHTFLYPYSLPWMKETMSTAAFGRVF